jgi:predicted transcriptional regulator
MLEAKYIKTMDFTFENVSIVNCENEWELIEKIEESGVIKIKNEDNTEYINSSYIM